MDFTATETKVQIRLSTRDAGLQIAEEPTVLLVQTCRFKCHARNQSSSGRPETWRSQAVKYRLHLLT